MSKRKATRSVAGEPPERSKGSEQVAGLSSAERERCRAGLGRMAQGVALEDLPARERRAVVKERRIREEKNRWDYYESIPSKHWQRMAGRRWQVITKQARTYGIPFDGATISLPAVVKKLHDFFADNARRLAAEETEDGMLLAGNSPALEKYRWERAKLARMDRLEREGRLIERDEVQEMLSVYTSLFRKGVQQLERLHGPDAAGIMTDAVDEGLAGCEALFDGSEAE